MIMLKKTNSNSMFANPWQKFPNCPANVCFVASLHPTIQDPIVGRVCNFLSSVSPQQRFEWWASVTAPLQLRVLFHRQRIVHPRGVRAGQTQRRDPSLSQLPLFKCFVSSPSEPVLCKPGLAMKGVCLFRRRFSLWSVYFSFVPFVWAFPFVCLFATTILDSFFLF